MKKVDCYNFFTKVREKTTYDQRNRKTILDRTK